MEKKQMQWTNNKKNMRRNMITSMMKVKVIEKELA